MWDVLFLSKKYVSGGYFDLALTKTGMNLVRSTYKNKCLRNLVYKRKDRGLVLVSSIKRDLLERGESEKNLSNGLRLGCETYVGLKQLCTTTTKFNY
jgi:hypothetical protein